MLDQLHYSYHEIGKLHSVKLEYNNAGSFSLASHWKTHSKHNRWNVKMQQKKIYIYKEKGRFGFRKAKGRKNRFFQSVAQHCACTFFESRQTFPFERNMFFFSSWHSSVIACDALMRSTRYIFYLLLSVQRHWLPSFFLQFFRVSSAKFIFVVVLREIGQYCWRGYSDVAFMWQSCCVPSTLRDEITAH